MNNKLSILIFLACSVFVLLGAGTIMTGDVDGTNESLFMVAYLGFFLSVMAVITLIRLHRKTAIKC